MLQADLNLLTLRYMQMNDFERLGLLCLLLVIGGLIGAVLWGGDARLNRSRYYLGLGATAFLLGTAQTAWLFWGPALAAGFGYVPALCNMATQVLAGMVLCWLAKARSRDGHGNASAAWMAFLPPFGLWLLSRRGPNPGTWLQAVPLYAMAIVLMALARLMGHMLGVEVENRITQDMNRPEVAAAFGQLMRQSTDLDAELDAVVTGTETPSLVGNGLILTGIRRDDLHLTLQIAFDPAAPCGDQPATAEDLTAYYCDLYGPQIAVGASLSLQFSGEGAPLSGTLDLSGESCLAG